MLTPATGSPVESSTTRPSAFTVLSQPPTTVATSSRAVGRTTRCRCRMVRPLGTDHPRARGGDIPRGAGPLRRDATALGDVRRKLYTGLRTGSDIDGIRVDRHVEALRVERERAAGGRAAIDVG